METKGPVEYYQRHIFGGSGKKTGPLLRQRWRRKTSFFATGGFLSRHLFDITAIAVALKDTEMGVMIAHLSVGTADFVQGMAHLSRPH